MEGRLDVRRKWLIFLLISLVAAALTAAAFRAGSPPIPPEIESLAAVSDWHFRVSTREGGDAASWHGESARGFIDVWLDADNSLPKLGWKCEKSQFAQREYSKDGWRLRITHWAKASDSRSPAMEPAELDLYRPAGLGDRLRAVLQAPFDR